ncbi:ABC transporter permease [Mariniblastus fucicola]|uniref:ABC-2 family transporter protein n=1 Tax=Mariniblastus fucicola TaxID=980251 RepID=A0A5B9PBM5_9BACT|nr:ABC transporter permease [Mariniblastus fucicola]QEG22420.1 ABC-2 family transporter protein [Mariniblastus fucicola]
MIGTVAWHEFWFTVRKKSYYLVTLGMPLLALGYLGIITLIIAMTVPGEISRMSKPTGLIDQSGILTAEGAPLADAVPGEVFEIQQTDDASNDVPEELKKLTGDTDINRFFEQKVVLLDSVDAGRAELEDESWKAIVVIPPDYIESGQVEVYTRRSDLFGSSMKTGWLSKMIRHEILKKTELTENEVERIRNFAQATKFEINSEGKFEEVNLLSKGLSMGIPLAVAGLLVLALMMNASALLASIAEEKENKVMEVIVSSVSADDLLFGKVLGIVCAGLLQIAIWMVMVSVIPIILQTVMNEFVDYDINVLQLLISGVFMVMGFLFYGSLLAGMGSLGSTYKDCQQLSAAVIICACVPMMMPTVFISDPNAMVPRVLSMIPFFSPIGMTLRLGSGDIALWEAAVSFLILAVSTWFAIKIAARLFRAGTLMRGKPPGIREIWKVLTQRT